MKFKTVIVLLILFVLHVGFAETAAPLTDAQMLERLEFVKSSLNEGESGATIWWWSWLGVYSAFAAGSFTVAAMSDRDTQKITSTVSDVQSSLGVIGMLITPFAPRYVPSQVRTLPAGTHGEIESSFNEGMRLFEAAAEDAAFGRSWITHAMALAVNGGGALVIWKKYGDRIEDDGGNPRKEALLNFVFGTIISEIQIFTQPIKAVNDMNEYRRRFGVSGRGNVENTIHFFAFPYSGGMMLGASFQW